MGGSVRDLLLGITPSELDLAVTGEEGDPVGSLARALGGTAMSVSQFGTARVGAGGVEFDVARTRRETYARPGALPTVTFAHSIDDDLPRRDFTIHAMAVSLNGDNFGELLDPLCGRRDLEARQVRILHSRSFRDDPTRILRAVRYAGRLVFEIEGETARLLVEDLRWLDSVSGDRIRRELERTVAEGRVADILGLAQGLGVLRAIHPALSLTAGLAARLSEAGAPSATGLVGALASSASEAARDGLVRRLGLPPNQARIAVDVGRVRPRLDRLNGDSLAASEAYRMLEDVHAGAVEAWALLHEDADVRARLGDYLRRIRGAAPMLDGRSVIALGIEEGPAVGETLRALLMARLDGAVSSREDEERFVKRSLDSLA